MRSCYVFIYLGFTVCSLFFLKKVKVQFRPYKTAVRLVCKKSHNCLTMLLFIRRAKSLSKSIIKGKTLLFIFEYMFSHLHPHFFIHVQGVPLKMEIAIPLEYRLWFPIINNDDTKDLTSLMSFRKCCLHSLFI